MNGIVDEIGDLRRRLSALERKSNSIVRYGIVREVDPETGRARVGLQDGEGGEFLTPFIPWQEAATGAAKSHMPLSVGQAVELKSHTGDIVDAVIQGSLNSSENPRPSSKGDEYVLLQVGAALVRVASGGDKIEMSVGGVSLTVSSAGVEIAGGQVTHNGTNIGDTHTHGGVSPGPNNTSTPN